MTTTATTATPAITKTVDPLKIVNIILPKNNEISTDNVSSSYTSDTRSVSTSTNASSTTSSSAGYVPPRNTKSDEILFAEPTFSEKFFRYLVVVIYLGGLSSLGFILSIYYLFFWDSRMPPVFKPTKKPPVFMKP